ncbi:hypothetical protein C8J57DRAFT_1705134 [Mycena rebaudengoi]|nr:hypothetical protein C8J57DRAFT_1705134 [Mycena rebaudengoi]
MQSAKISAVTRTLQGSPLLVFNCPGIVRVFHATTSRIRLRARQDTEAGKHLADVGFGGFARARTLQICRCQLGDGTVRAGAGLFAASDLSDALLLVFSPPRRLSAAGALPPSRPRRPRSNPRSPLAPPLLQEAPADACPDRELQSATSPPHGVQTPPFLALPGPLVGDPPPHRLPITLSPPPPPAMRGRHVYRGGRGVGLIRLEAAHVRAVAPVECPPAAIYESQTPVSMAKMIMSRHVRCLPPSLFECFPDKDDLHTNIPPPLPRAAPRLLPAAPTTLAPAIAPARGKWPLCVAVRPLA